MSYYQIELDDKALAEQINSILNRVLTNELANKYSGTGREISAAVKELIYSHKEEIIERVVEKASRELVKKGLPKLIERFEQ